MSVRTLHHYDAIGLARPSGRTAAGYRAYAAGDMERLREVLAYRRLGFGLREIAELVDDPSADAVAHLHRLRGLLLERRDRADEMVTAIDRELSTRAKGLEVTPEEQLNLLGARLYDTIGDAYTATRRTDPRIAAQIWDALGDARTVLNVGAGTGSYEPADRRVTAVEPSAVMRGQRPPGSAPCVDAPAECLPFADRSFDVAMAVSTVHHWGGTRSRGCANCGVWPAAWWCSPSTPTSRGGRTGSGSPATTCPSSPVSSRNSPPRRDGRRDRHPRRSGARAVGLRRRPVRGVLAPAGGVSGGACTPCDVGVDENRAGGGGACGTQSRRRPRLRPVGRTQRRSRRPRRGGSRACRTIPVVARRAAARRQVRALGVPAPGPRTGRTWAWGQCGESACMAS
ncbi:DNA-binding transcriptional regulator, MerR family [Streptomyces sp. LaPpAH-199]|nr:DNA-binding transcriptional regulator, MerR family [Streptomyces sp. LaPpAH-199]